MPLYGPSQTTIINALSNKQPARAATTASITIATALNNGDTLDGVVLATGDRVLVKDQAAPAENGVYIVAASPARASDFNVWSEIPGSQITILEGTANADTSWLCTSNAGGTLGVTAITFVSYAAGNVTSSANITDNAIVRGDGGAKGIQNSGWRIDDNNQMSLAVPISGDENEAITAITSGADAISIFGSATGAGSIGVRGQTNNATGIGVRAVANTTGIAFQIQNASDFKASFTFAGTADRAITFPDLDGTVVYGSTGTTDEALVRTDGTTSGKVQGSTVLVDDSGNMTFPTGSSIRVPTGATMSFQVFDTNDATLRQFMLAASGATPSVDWSAPSGGTLTLNPTSIGATTAGTGAFTTITATGAITSTLSAGNAAFKLQNGTGSDVHWNGVGRFRFSADGVAVLLNDAANGFTRLNLGGTTSSFPSIKRNSAAINFRLADDSADAAITAGAASISGNLTISNGANIILGTTTGTNIGTAADQKLGFYGVAPAVQQAAVSDASGGAVEDTEARTAINALLARLRTLGLIAT